MSLKIKKKFKVFFEINTRWSDNDVYHHVNNVVYYSYFDTAVNNFLIEKKGSRYFKWKNNWISS